MQLELYYENEDGQLVFNFESIAAETSVEFANYVNDSIKFDGVIKEVHHFSSEDSFTLSIFCGRTIYFFTFSYTDGYMTKTFMPTGIIEILGWKYEN